MIAKESLDFLDDLKKNNSRDWFLANKKRYEQYKSDYLQLTADVLENMAALDPALKHLEVKDCQFRINRDIRFTKDKSPYKTHMGIWMSTGQKNTNLAGYYIHIARGESFIAGGVYHPDAADLKKIRKEIAFFHDDLEKVLSEKKFKKEFGTLDRNPENALKTAPKDFDKDHVAIEWLKLKSFTASQKIDDRFLEEKDFAKKVTQKLAALKPLTEFLNRALGAE